VKCAGGGGVGGKLGGKLGKGKGRMAAVAMTEANSTAEADYVGDAFARAVLQNGCGEEERGHRASGQAHMAYNRDGYYVEAAACYIVKKFKAGGGGRAAMMER
jgi:hypothetical protein